MTDIQNREDRLSRLLGQVVSVWLKGVTANFPDMVPAPEGICPPPRPYPAWEEEGKGSITAGTPIIPGVPGTGNVRPINVEHVSSLFLEGTLAYIGCDFLVLQVIIDCSCVNIAIPFCSIGKITPGNPAAC